MQELTEKYQRLQAEHETLKKAAEDVIERWETPLWKDAPATAGFINRLRNALPEKEKPEPKKLYRVISVPTTIGYKTPAGMFQVFWTKGMALKTETTDDRWVTGPWEPENLQELTEEQTTEVLILVGNFDRRKKEAEIAHATACETI